MESLTSLGRRAQGLLADWRALRLTDSGFWHREEAKIAVLVLAAIGVIAVSWRYVVRHRMHEERIVLPALLPGFRGPGMPQLRHLPLLLFLAGIPFLVLALSDPHSPLVRQMVSYPGRRIAIMVDASSSMSTPFDAVELTSGTAFSTTVSAAERFIELRRRGRYRDLMALIEFGNRAYVITPFTSDYDNLLLSASLIGHPDEFAKFPDKGTMIGVAIIQSIELYRTFDFLDASGNLMVIFSDGEDERVTQEGRTVLDIVQDAVDAEIPIHFIRTNADKLMGEIIPDRIWRDAVERTGGKFYAAANEETILRAITEIDQGSEGRIDVQRYAERRALFAPLAGIAFLFWGAAGMLKLTVPHFRSFP